MITIYQCNSLVYLNIKLPLFLCFPQTVTNSLNIRFCRFSGKHSFLLYTKIRAKVHPQLLHELLFFRFVVFPGFTNRFFTFRIIGASTFIADKLFPSEIRNIFFKFFDNSCPCTVFSSNRAGHSGFDFHRHRLLIVLYHKYNKSKRACYGPFTFEIVALQYILDKRIKRYEE
nr:MAG TPA: hypothetical protein [Caudoviricetes sp.]